MKSSGFAVWSARAGLVGVTAGLVLAGGNPVGAYGSTARVAFVSAAPSGQSAAPTTSATPAQAATPGAPTGLTARGGKGQVTLSWAAPQSSGISPITGYDIYVGTTAAFRGGAPAALVTGRAASVVVTGLRDATTYYFEVAAVNAHGAGPSSSAVSATTLARPQPTVPGPPAALSTQPGQARVILSWVAPAPNGSAKISGYFVYAGTQADGESGTPVNRVPIQGTTCVVAGLAAGTTYYFRVAAVDAMGRRGALSAEILAIPMSAASSGSATSPGSTTSPGSATGSGSTAGSGSGAGQGATVTPAGGQQDGASAIEATNLTQDPSSSGVPVWLIILLAAVAVAALIGAVAAAVHLRRMRTHQGQPPAWPCHDPFTSGRPGPAGQRR